MPSFLISIALTALGLIEDAPLCPTFSFGSFQSLDAHYKWVIENFRHIA